MKPIIISLIALFSVLSCKSAAVTTPVDSSEAVSSAAFFKEIAKEPTFDQVKISSRVTAETGSYVPPIDATIYIEKDQKVWMNMAAVFFNVARGIATPQGIKGYEKWNKTYIESDYSYLNRMLGVEFLSYERLEDLLLGKSFVPLDPNSFELRKNVSGYTLSSRGPLSLGGETSGRDYQISLQYASNFDLNKVLLQQSNSNNSLEATYSNWKTLSGQRLPGSVKINIKGEKNGLIGLENTKFEFTPISTPYSVPGDYTKVEIR